MNGDDELELALEPFDPETTAERERTLIESVRALRDPRLNDPHRGEADPLTIHPF